MRWEMLSDTFGLYSHDASGQWMPSSPLVTKMSPGINRSLGKEGVSPPVENHCQFHLLWNEGRIPGLGPGRPGFKWPLPRSNDMTLTDRIPWLLCPPASSSPRQVVAKIK